MSRLPRKLQGQVAIVTGASRGIGAAAAELLARAGAAVVLMARTPDAIEQAARRIQEAGGRAIPVAGDVADYGQVEEVVEAALTQFDRVDILVNNAGVIWPIEEAVHTDPDEWAYNIHVNLVGPYNMARNVLPVMLDQGYGRVVNITSGAAEHVVPGWSAYCAAKAGLNMLTQALATELSGTGITVNALSPGMVDTEMQAEIRSVDAEALGFDYRRFHEAHRRRRLRGPEEVARWIYWLVGPWSRDRTGEIFRHSDEAWRARVAEDLRG